MGKLHAAVLQIAVEARQEVLHGVESIRLLWVIVLYAPPSQRLSVAWAFAKDMVRLGMGHLTGGGREITRAPGSTVPPPPRWVTIPHTPVNDAPYLLSDPRVQRLQRTAARVVFERQWGITVRPREADILQAFSSIPWLQENLRRACGFSPAVYIPFPEFQLRTEVVYPIFMQSIRLHRGYLQSQTTEITPTPAHRRRSRRHAVGPHGEITGSLFPEAIPMAQRQLKREERRVLIARRYRADRMHRGIRSFDRYLHGVNTICQLPLKGNRRLERRLIALQRITMPPRTGHSIPLQGGAYGNLES